MDEQRDTTWLYMLTAQTQFPKEHGVVFYAQRLHVRWTKWSAHRLTREVTLPIKPYRGTLWELANE